MLRKILEKFQKNKVAKKDKEIMDNLVSEGNEHLNELKKIDQEILTIQNSTKTTFSFFSPVHNYCRTKYAWYYDWHTKPYATKIHAGFLALVLLSSISIGSFSIIGKPSKSFASANTCVSAGILGPNSFNAESSWTDCGGTTPQLGDSVVITSGHNVIMYENADIGTGSVTINSGGTLDVSGYELTATNITNSGTLIVATAGGGGSGTINVSGDWTNTGVFNAGTAPTGSVTYTNYPAEGDTFTLSDGVKTVVAEYDTNASCTPSDTRICYSLPSLSPAALINSINNSGLNIRAAQSGYTINFTGTVAGTAGNVDIVLTPSGQPASKVGMQNGAYSGTVNFNGAGGSTQNISGNNVFNNFTAQASAARTIKFAAGSTTTVAGTFDVDGASDQLLTLNSSSEGSPWNLAVTSDSPSVTNVSVEDSDASSGNVITALDSYSGEGNTNWNISAPAPPTVDYTCTWDGTTGNWSDTTKWANCNGEYPGQTGTVSYDVSISSGSVTLDVASIDITGGDTSFGDITIGGTLITSGNALTMHSITVAGTLTASTSTLTVKGNWTNNGAYNPGSSYVRFNGSSDQTISGSATHSFYVILVDKTGGDLKLGANVELITGPGLFALEVGTGDTLNLQTYTLTLTNVSDGIALWENSSSITASSTDGKIVALADIYFNVLGQTGTYNFGNVQIGDDTHYPSLILQDGSEGGSIFAFGDLSSVYGSLASNNSPITVFGNLILGPDTDLGTSLVKLTGSGESIVYYGTYFYDLNIDVSNVPGGKTVKFVAGNNVAVTHSLVFNGDADSPLTLRSDNDGDPWYFEIPEPMTSGNYIDVKDSWSATANKITSGKHVTGANQNNSGWIFNQTPNAPTLLGPAGFVDGTVQNDKTPTLTFTLSDPDAADQVKYQIQIDNDSDFSSPVVNFISELQEQGNKSYTTSALWEGNYFWRVRAINDSDQASEYSVPGEAGVADIKIDTVAPVLNITAPLAGAKVNGGALVSFTDGELTSAQCSIDNISWSACTSGETSLTDVANYPSLNDGLFTLYLKDTDAAGNTGTDSEAGIIKDEIGPTVTLTTAIASPTNASTIPITATFSEDVTGFEIGDITVTNGAASAFVASSSTVYTFSVTPADQGPVSVNIASSTAVDSAGNSNSSATELTRVYDSIAPTVSASSTGPDGSGGYYISVPDITLESSDEASEIAETYYRWGDSGEYSPYAGATILNPPNQGENILYYYAVDSAGNSGSETPADSTYLIDTGAPTGGSLSIDKGAYTRDTSITLTLSASDATSGMSQIGISENDSDYVWSEYAVSKAHTIIGSQGLVTIYVKYKDIAGNSSGAVTDTITYDGTAPSVPGTPSTSTPTKVVRPTWNWGTSTDGNSGMNKYEVQLDGGSWINVGDTTFWTTTSDLANGSHSLNVKAFDNAGNESAASEAGSVLVDLAIPSISAFTIANGDSTTTSRDVALQITGADASSGLFARSFSQDGVTYSDWESCNNTTCNGEKSFTLNDGDGTKTVYIKLKDAAGNESVPSSDTILLDTTGPGVFSLYVPANNSWTNLSSVSLSWEAATDLASGLAKYQLYLDDVIIDDNISNSITSYDLSNLSTGTHTWQVKAIDTLNNGTLSEKRIFGIDQTVPTTPTNVAVANLSNPDLKLVKDLPVKIGWTASEDTGAGVLSYLVYIGSTPGASDILNGAETIINSYEADLQKDGLYYVSVKAKGKAGNLSVLSPEASFEVDHTAPSAISKTAGFDISNRVAGTYSAYIAWSSSTDPSGRGIKEYVIYQGSEKIGVIPFNTDGKESLRRFVKTNLKTGSYSFKVAAVDLADNMGAFSQESKVEISAETGPALSISDLKATPSTLVDPDSGKTSILISWKTSALSTSVVEMEGKTYGEEDLAKLNTGHSILITGLKDSTTYRFTAKSRDIFGNEVTSESASVRTGIKVEKQSPLEVILNSLRDIFSVFRKVSAAALQKIGVIKPTQITKEGLIAYNVSSTETGNTIVISLVKAGQSIEKSTDGKSFSQLASPAEGYYIDDQVTAENTYYYRVSGSTGVARVNLGDKDSKPPVISDPKVIEEATQLADDKVRVAIGWQTDVPGTSQINYGIGGTNLESTKDENLNTNHFTVIEGLKSGTEYKFKVKSLNEDGLSSESGEFSFSTPKTAESQNVINVIIRQLQDVFSKLMSWMRI